jgi:hypothetical protein
LEELFFFRSRKYLHFWAIVALIALGVASGNFFRTLSAKQFTTLLWCVQTCFITIFISYKIRQFICRKECIIPIIYWTVLLSSACRPSFPEPVTLDTFSTSLSNEWHNMANVNFLYVPA